MKVFVHAVDAHGLKLGGFLDRDDQRMDVVDALLQRLQALVRRVGAALQRAETQRELL
jgi:hypothetical protein